jgi:UDP-glucose 4-epimerase
MSAEKVLVTGGAGFIGSELVRQLLAAGHSVVAVDNLVCGRRENVQELSGDNFSLVVADVRDRVAMDTVLDHVSVVYHLACLGVRHSIHSPFENHDVNATATLNLLTWARAKNIRRFVYVSSSEVYGTAHWVPMTEEHPTYPMTVYGAAKIAGECYTRAFWNTYRYPTVVVRPFNAYGPRCHHEGDSGEVIPKFMLRALAGKPMIIFGDGTQTRDFTYVSDTAHGIMLAGLSDDAVGKTFNIGNGKETQIIDLAHTVAELLGVDQSGQRSIVFEEPRPGDVLRLYAETTLSRTLLNFEPTVSLHDGLSRLRDWYKTSRFTAEELLSTERVHNWESDPNYTRNTEGMI